MTLFYSIFSIRYRCSPGFMMELWFNSVFRVIQTQSDKKIIIITILIIIIIIRSDMRASLFGEPQNKPFCSKDKVGYRCQWTIFWLEVFEMIEIDWKLNVCRWYLSTKYQFVILLCMYLMTSYKPYHEKWVHRKT